MQILIILFIFSSPTYLYSLALNDHAELTKIAIKEFTTCFQYESPSIQRGQDFEELSNIIIEANLQEDTYYFNKMLQYSHFYNPYVYVNAKWFNIIDRCPSSYRILHIEQILQGYLKRQTISAFDLFWDHRCQHNIMQRMMGPLNPPSPSLYYSQEDLIDTINQGDLYPSWGNNQQSDDKQYFYLLGQAIHHLQDMSSPTHVVPIMHFSISDWNIVPFQDGFESYTNRIKILERIVEESNASSLDTICHFKNATPQTLFEILDEGAKKTLRSLSQEVPISVITNPNIFERRSVTWEKWYDTTHRDANGFSQYGVYGNTFGSNLFYLYNDDPTTPENEGTRTILVDMEIYDDFVYQQYKQAIESTQKALHFFSLKVN